jgi:hypothetical protein
VAEAAGRAGGLWRVPADPSANDASRSRRTDASRGRAVAGRLHDARRHGGTRAGRQPPSGHPRPPTRSVPARATSSPQPGREPGIARVRGRDGPPPRSAAGSSRALQLLGDDRAAWLSQPPAASASSTVAPAGPPGPRARGPRPARTAPRVPARPAHGARAGRTSPRRHDLREQPALATPGGPTMSHRSVPLVRSPSRRSASPSVARSASRPTVGARRRPIAASVIAPRGTTSRGRR